MNESWSSYEDIRKEDGDHCVRGLCEPEITGVALRELLFSEDTVPKMAGLATVSSPGPWSWNQRTRVGVLSVISCSGDSVSQFPHLKLGRSDEMIDMKGFCQLESVVRTLDILVWGQLDTLKRGKESREGRDGNFCLNGLQEAGKGGF